MYTPPFNLVDDEEAIRAMVTAARVAWLVTVGPDGVPQATLLPIMWRGPVVVAHMAKANGQWREIGADSPGLLICTGPDAYVSPSWYAAKAEHGRVVPTWNYSAVHLTGTIRIHEDEQWLRGAVTELTEVHEDGRESPWQVADAPDSYVTGQLRGIVGIEFAVTGITGKAKLSQNRSAADRDGVISGLRDEPFGGAEDIAEEMDRARSAREE